VQIRTSGRAERVIVGVGAPPTVWGDIDVEIDPPTGIVQLLIRDEAIATAHLSVTLIKWRA
jgi:hypothetical protein